MMEKLSEGEKNRVLEECGQAQNSAQHYNQMIWVIFSVGVALSLFILHFVWINWRNDILGDRLYIRLFMIIFGYSTFIYCISTIRSFQDKKKILYGYHNNCYKLVAINKKHPLENFDGDKFGRIFSSLSLFLIHFAYVHTLLRLFFEKFSISLNLSSLIIISLSSSFILLLFYIILRKLINSFILVNIKIK